MPVGENGFPAMVCNARFQSSRAEGAADIHIETGLELQGPKFSDYNWSLFQRREDECICAGQWVHGVGTKKSVGAAFRPR